MDPKYYTVPYQDIYIEKKKSKNMNLKFKSTEADLKFNIQSQIRILNQNILYITRQVDLLVKWMKADIDNANLQQQVDKYFDKDSENDIPEDAETTAEQTQ